MPSPCHSPPGLIIPQETLSEVQVTRLLSWPLFASPGSHSLGFIRFGLGALRGLEGGCGHPSSWRPPEPTDRSHQVSRARRQNTGADREGQYWHFRWNPRHHQGQRGEILQQFRGPQIPRQQPRRGGDRGRGQAARWSQCAIPGRPGTAWASAPSSVRWVTVIAVP